MEASTKPVPYAIQYFRSQDGTSPNPLGHEAASLVIVVNLSRPVNNESSHDDLCTLTK